MANHQDTITESDILQTYLLTPSSLPTILPFTNFTSLAPQASRSNPQLKTLYRDLQFHRTIITDTLRENITRESRRSTGLQAALTRSIRVENGQPSKKRPREDDNEATTTTTTATLEPTESTDQQIDSTIHPASNAGLASQARYHDAPSLLDAMEQAADELEAEIAELDTRTEETLEALNEAVGALSDLRYGRFARAGDEGAGVEENVVQSLQDFVAAAEVQNRAVR